MNARKQLLWAGRGLGSLVAGFWLFVGIAEATVGDEPLTGEATMMASLIIASVLAVAVA